MDFLIADFAFVGGNTHKNKPFWDSHVEYSSIALLDTIVEMRAEGLSTPYVVMWPNSPAAFPVFYEKYYGQDKWKDCFVWRNGKPFILHWNYKASETDLFTDNFNVEFSRDIEPMEGGHGDLYYRWLCEYVRAYKAHEPCPTLFLQKGL